MEICTKLHPRSVFVAGEQVKCTIQFQLQSTASPQSLKSLVVAWASVQLQCECVMASDTMSGGSSANLAMPSSHNQLSTGGMGSRKVSKTSLRPVDWLEGTQIMASSPKLLFCEMTLREGEVRTFTYAEPLPYDIPPSYRGKNIKFNYNLLIGAQLLNSSVEVLKVPFRVLTSPLIVSDPLAVNGRLDHNPLSIPNPFLKESTPDEEVESALHAGFLAVKQPAMYNIAIPSGHIAKLSMPRKNFQMGEEIVASLLFLPDSEVRCVQYSINLVCEEEICVGNSKSDRKVTKSSLNKVSKAQDFTLGFEECSLRIGIPLHATPSFSAALCSLSWRLQFEFVIVSNKDFKPPTAEGDQGLDSDFCEWNAPQRLNVQTLEWALPIQIFPADPAHVEWLRCTKTQKHVVFASPSEGNVIQA